MKKLAPFVEIKNSINFQASYHLRQSEESSPPPHYLDYANSVRRMGKENDALPTRIRSDLATCVPNTHIP